MSKDIKTLKLLKKLSRNLENKKIANSVNNIFRKLAQDVPRPGAETIPAIQTSNRIVMVEDEAGFGYGIDKQTGEITVNYAPPRFQASIGRKLDPISHKSSIDKIKQMAISLGRLTEEEAKKIGVARISRSPAPSTPVETPAESPVLTGRSGGMKIPSEAPPVETAMSRERGQLSQSSEWTGPDGNKYYLKVDSGSGKVALMRKGTKGVFNLIPGSANIPGAIKEYPVWPEEAVIQSGAVEDLISPDELRQIESSMPSQMLTQPIVAEFKDLIAKRSTASFSDVESIKKLANLKDIFSKAILTENKSPFGRGSAKYKKV